MRRVSPLRIMARVDAFEYLPVGHQTDGDTGRGMPGDERNSRLSAIEVIGDPVRIDQIGHRSTGGRVEILRLS